MGDAKIHEVGHPGRVEVDVSPEAKREQSGLVDRPADKSRDVKGHHQEG